MNNIEILEDYIKLINKGYCKDCNELCNIYGTPAFPSKAIAEAIENLIKENKELKEKDMQHELELIGKEEYTKDAIGEIIEHYYTANENCIPKSKVKEKIEELEKLQENNRKDMEHAINFLYFKQIDKISTALIINAHVRDILKQLLEEGE